jgi:hypothetical protein
MAQWGAAERNRLSFAQAGLRRVHQHCLVK